MEELRKIILENEGDREDIYSDVLEYLKTKVLIGSQNQPTVVLPRRLTAENGAKALLRGEFTEVIHHGKNDERLEIPVSWDNIKRIYDEIVSNLGINENNN